VSYIHGIWTDPEAFDLTLTEGTEQEEVLTIGNDGTETLNFSLRTRTVVQSVSESAVSKASGAIPETPQKMVFDVQQALMQEHKPGQVLVRFVPGTETMSLAKEMQQEKVSANVPGAEIIRQFSSVPGLSLVQIPEGVTVEEALESFNQRQDVLYAQPNYRVYTDSTIPNDARFDDLWGLHNIGQSGGLVDADIDAPEAWDISTGSDTVIVAVIDTGVDYNHEDLAANMWVNQAEYEGTGGVDDDGNGYVDDIYGYDFDHGDGDPMDDHYHGTHCAGTIGALGNNGVGVTGVCWNVKIMAVKFLDSGGGGWTDDAIDSVEYATLMGAHIMSNSWGGGGYSQGLKDAIDAAGAAGITFVAAAGNDSVNNDTNPHYPSSYSSSNIIAVLSTDRNDNLSGFSSWGPTSVDIGAPGTSILSCEPGNQYQYLNGTSMATPHVSGACALLKSINPSLTVPEIQEILFNSVDEISSLSGKCVTEGRLNINGAILETTVPWIEFDIEQGILGPDESIPVSVTFDATELSPGVYNAEILVVSDDLARPTISIPVELTVLPDPLEVAPEASFDPNGLVGGPFEPNSMTYTMTNTGDTPLDWSIQSQANWLTISQTAGTLESDEIVEILVSINENADVLDPNLYQETIIFNNLTLGSIHHREVNLKVLPPDMFTEQFDAGTFDLENKAITLRPDSSVSYYAACVEKESFGAFPLSVNAITLVSIGDDDYVEVPFDNSEQFTFYGVSYDRVYIGSNGYLTFGRGGSEFEPTLENHFDIPRIAPLFTDLTPTNGQSISYEQLNDRFVVTYNDIPVFGDKNATNSFQVELFFADGSIRIAYLDIAATTAISGLSDGNGLPGIFEPSNLSSYINCCDCGDSDGDGVVGLGDLCEFGLVWLENTCAEIPTGAIERTLTEADRLT
jgi:subtilisin family serine protease